jgi:hypothetical protein
MKKMIMVGLCLGSLALLGGCAPEVGTEAWCKMMDETPKGEWTGNQAADYAKHCLIR